MLANAITISRIILAFLLLPLEPLQPAFLLVYLLGGLSDVADGYVARRTHTVSTLGSKLDSIADLVLIAVLLYILYPILQPSKEILLWIASIALIRLSAVTAARIRYGHFASLHTYANKATGLALFLLPFSLMVSSPAIPLMIVLTLATYSAIEELGINITSKKLNLETKGFFDNL